MWIRSSLPRDSAMLRISLRCYIVLVCLNCNFLRCQSRFENLPKRWNLPSSWEEMFEAQCVFLKKLTFSAVICMFQKFFFVHDWNIRSTSTVVYIVQSHPRRPSSSSRSNGCKHIRTRIQGIEGIRTKALQLHKHRRPRLRKITGKLMFKLRNKLMNGYLINIIMTLWRIRYRELCNWG